MKAIYFPIAWISFALGIIGIFLPILPTTPFLILAAFLFSKSSPRFHQWILNLPVAGEGVRDWQQNRVINPRAKLICASMLLISGYILWNYSVAHVAVKSVVTLVLASVGTFVVSRKSSRE